MRLLSTCGSWLRLHWRVLVPWPLLLAGLAIWMVCLVAGGLNVPLMSEFGDPRLIYFVAPLFAMSVALCTRTAPLLEDTAPSAGLRVQSGVWAACMALVWGVPAAVLLGIYQVDPTVIITVCCVNLAFALLLARLVGPIAGGFVPLLVTALAMFNTGTNVNLLFGWLYDPGMPRALPIAGLVLALVLHGVCLRRPVMR